jgi:hypothetical protein
MDRIAKIYVINLEHRKDRLESIQEELTYLGLWDKTERIEASVIRAHGDGSAGIADSYARCLQKALDEDLEYVMVLQDDCKFLFDRERLDLEINRFLDTVPSNWAGVWIGSLYRFYDNNPEINYEKPVWRVHDTAVIYHKRAYNAFIDYYKMCRDKYIETGESRYVLDQLINNRETVPFEERENVYIIKEKLATQADGYSDRTFENMWGGSYVELFHTAAERHKRVERE